jgi:sporulation protein YlmC with PRC-barrel domain
MSYLDRDPHGMYRNEAGEGPGPRLMGAGTLMSEDVSNLQGEDLGDIKEIMLDMQTGEVAYAVLSFGGVMGMGTKLFAVPWKALQLDTENKRFVLDITKESLQRAPGFDKDDWPDMASPQFLSEMQSFYKHGTTIRMSDSGSMMGQAGTSLQSESKYGTESDRGDFSAQSSNLDSSKNQI